MRSMLVLGLRIVGLCLAPVGLFFVMIHREYGSAPYFGLTLMGVAMLLVWQPWLRWRR